MNRRSWAGCEASRGGRPSCRRRGRRGCTLLSDVDLAFAAALRLPTFHVAGVERLKRLTLVADRERVIRYVDYPINDPVRSVRSALEAISAMSERWRR